MTLHTHEDVNIDRAESIVVRLAASLATRRIYAPDHSRAAANIESLLGELRLHFRTGKPFTIAVADDQLTYQGIPLKASHKLGLVATRLAERRAGGVVFGPDVTAAALTELVNWLIERVPRPLERKLRGIEIKTRGGDGRDGNNPISRLVPEFRVPHEIHGRANAVLEHVNEDLRAGRKLDLREILDLSQWASEAACAEGTKLIAPTQSITHDEYTFHHSVNVFLISTALLQPFARDRKELARFAQAALLHDVGKTRVPREVLYKDGSLTEEEFAFIRKHPIYGAEILQGIQHVDPMAIEVAFCHHMRDGGQGYPVARLPIDPGPVSNMVQVADMFEALTAHRPYSKGHSSAGAIEKILATPGMASKRHAIAILLDRLTKAPPGSRVRLVSGESAIVLKTHSQHPDRPLVRVFEDADGVLLAEPYDLDLRTVDPAENVIASVTLKPGMLGGCGRA